MTRTAWGVWDDGRAVERDWLLITVSTPPGGTSTLRVYAWRKLRSLGAHYLQQSVCLLPATPKTTRAAARLVTRLREEGGHGEMLRIRLSDAKQEAAVIDAIQRERTDEYRELVESTRQFHEELQLERRRGRATYTELEESDADLARYQKWLAAIRARDYFDAPGGQEAAAAVASCEEALARFESEALSAELDEPTPDSRPGLRALEAATTDAPRSRRHRASSSCAASFRRSGLRAVRMMSAPSVRACRVSRARCPRYRLSRRPSEALPVPAVWGP